MFTMQLIQSRQFFNLVALNFVNFEITLCFSLEESRQQSKNLEKEKFTYQVECLEMKEKLNFLQNAALKCSCISVSDKSSFTLICIENSLTTLLSVKKSLNNRGFVCVTEQHCVSIFFTSLWSVRKPMLF